MLAIFCLRLAGGLAASLLLLPPAQVAPRFYRTQFLIVLGLAATAVLFLGSTATVWLWGVLGMGLILAFLGSVAWSLEGSPGGRTLIVLATLDLAVAMVLARPEPSLAWALADDLTSAALLGTATSAMLLGHSYLIAPGMAIAPLLRLLTALFVTTALRMGFAGAALWSWTDAHGFVSLEGDMLLWLPLRWGLGFVGPLVFGWMARESAKIRSTQSATGILYVVVIFCFLGELTGQLLQPVATSL